MLGSCFPKAPQCLEGAQVSVKLRLWLFSFQKSSQGFKLEIPVLTAPGHGDTSLQIAENVTRQKHCFIILAPANHICIIVAEDTERVHPLSTWLGGQAKATAQDPFPFHCVLAKEVRMEIRAPLPCLSCVIHSGFNFSLWIREMSLKDCFHHRLLPTFIPAIRFTHPPTTVCRSFLLSWRRQKVITVQFLETI